MRSHHGIIDEMLESDERKDVDAMHDIRKEKLTLTESLVALALSITCVSMIAVFLVDEIEFIVFERGVKDA